ncbi:ABC transporter permease [Desertimonas flava]|uniref:ABC transporter permease n=1 Tax=Desertimonas flava TaxID=2064846 RepID=UPI000E34C8C0|nr:FtsX-like permease family protein [Desertimonas flava]
MLGMTLRSMFARKRRMVSMALAVVLGVAFLAGTLVFTDTISRTFDDLFADIYDDTDTIVRSATGIEVEMAGEQRGRIPQSTLSTVQGVAGVADAQGFVQGFAQLVDHDGDAIGNPGQGPPTLGMSYLSGRLGPWTLTQGSRAPGPGELAIDRKSARDGDLELGDLVTVITQTGAHEFPLVGIVRFGSVDSLAGASVALFDLTTAQQVLIGDVGELDTIMVAAEPGVSEEEVTERVAGVLPDGQEAVTGAEMTEEQQDYVADAMGFFTTFLLVFAVIGLVVACFTIFNTFQIVITQRLREMALLRAIGATRRQVLAAQLLEAVVVGTISSAVGLGVGVGVAQGLKALMAGFGIDLPAGGTVLQLRTVAASMVIGTAATVVSAVFPALRASRVPPIAALRDVAVDVSAHSSRRLLIGGATTALGVAAFVAGLVGSEIAWVGLGALVTFLGVFVLGPLVAGPTADTVGAPLARFRGIAGRLARQNATRNPKRTARTGGALMIGVALVIAINVIAASAKDWIRDVIGTQFTGSHVVTSDTFAFGGLSPELGAELSALPEIEAAAGVRTGVAQIVGDGDLSDIAYVAVDPDSAGQVFEIGVADSVLESLDETGILLDDGEAAARRLGVGDVIDVRFIDGTTRPLTVTGIYADDELAGKFVVSQGLHESTGADQFDFAVYIAVAPGVSDDEARAAMQPIVDRFANAELVSRTTYIDDQAAQIDPLVNQMYALLALAVGIALFSIANSMALSVYERTRELGLLRAVGMDRGQTRSSVRWEAAIVGLIGTVLGLLIGVSFGWAISVTIRGDGLEAFSLPLQPVAVVTLLALAGAVLAATRPARRAAHVDILRAITTE